MENKNISLGIDELDLDVRTFAAFKRAGINTVEDYLNYPDKDKLRSVVGNRNFEKFLKASKPAEPPAAQSSSDTSVFDYSELDSDTAAKLESVTAEIFNVRKDYIFTMAKKVAYAHELLANCGNGKFGAWCESLGISRDTGNNLVRIAELFGNSTSEEQVNLNKLTDGNIKLLYEAAKPSAPPKLVEQVKSGDITTPKEYIELKKQLDEANKKADFWIKTNSETNKENQQLRAERVTAMNRADNAERKNSELEQRVKELENRPVDVAIQTDDSLLKEKDQEISELKEQIERMSDKTVKSFVIRMSLDEYEQLIKALEQADDRLKNIIKNARILKI